jgi:ribosome biogenesis GTPase
VASVPETGGASPPAGAPVDAGEGNPPPSNEEGSASSMAWAEHLPIAGDGERRLVRCVARGLLKQFDVGYRNLMAVGDRVNLVIPEVRGEALGEAQGFITRILPRSRCIERVAPGWRAVQLLAANVDLLVIVASAAEPPFRPGFVDRALLMAECADIQPLIVLNKIDLGVSEEVRRHLDDFAAAGYRILQTSAIRREGTEELKKLLAGKVSVLNGHSGVGKSSLLAAMDPSLKVEVQDVSEATGRGRHTTTSSRMYRISGVGWIIDTPGIRELSPAGVRRSNLWQFFPEIRSRAGICAFSNCSHMGEKGCGIEQAALRGEFSLRRLEGYRRIYKTLPEG